MTRFKRTIKLSLLLCLTFIFSCVERKIEDAIEHAPPVKSRGKSQEPRGVWHTVEPGQTLWRICKAYEVEMNKVAKVNHINDPTEIAAGQKIFIPGAARLKKVEPYQPPKPDNNVKPGRPDVYERGTSSVSSGKLMWPLPEGTIFSSFGWRGATFHEGIDLSSRPGTPIFAAEDGRVVYCDNTIRGYGNMIVIKHPGNLSTVYAHNQVNYVREGDFVRRGQKIAEVGMTGKASGPHLHFEVRAGKQAVNPLKYLESRNQK